MSPLATRIRETGVPALAGLALLAACLVFLLAAVRPLERRQLALSQELESATQHGSGLKRVRSGTNGAAPGAKLEAFYHFFERTETAPDWLAKLHGIAGAAGLDPRSGEYRLDNSQRRLRRYQVVLPVTGSYMQIRAFVQNALVEIPVLALDQINFRRKTTSDRRIEADIAFTLYLAAP